MAVDPVCGMTVDPAKAAGQFEHKGETYFSCSKGCLAKFAAEPEKHLAGAREPMAHGPAVLSIGGLNSAAAPSKAGERSAEASASDHAAINPQSAIPNPQSKDPVCGMTVDPAKAAGQFEHKGETYLFGEKACLKKSAAEPKKSRASAREPMAHGPAVLSIGGLKRS